jgi:hypothetical protein
VFSNFKMTFTEICNEYVKVQYEKANSIIEYGSGGSTLLAAKLAKQIVTVESCNSWLIELLGSAAEQRLPGTIIPIWVDVGPTGDWGTPKDESKWKNWHKYPKNPWLYCNEHNILPDLVLIDGRYRVACFLATCIYAKKETIVLFDDYEPRKHYHTVEKLFEKVDVIDDRMAVFRILPNQLSSRALLDRLHFFNDVR